MLKAIAALIVIAFTCGILFTNSHIVKVDGFQQLQCVTHKCFKAGNTVYMIK